MAGNVAILMDGYQIHKTTFKETGSSILHLMYSKKKWALFELFEKCNDATKEYCLSSQAKKVLRKYDFLDENDHVPKHVKKFVLNALTMSDDSLFFHNPIREVCKL